MNSKIYIRVDTKSPRLDYVLDVIFRNLLGVGYVLNNNEKRAHINYSSWKIDNCLNCAPMGLLPEIAIRKDLLDEIEISSWENTYCFFKTSSSNELPFDIFSAAFFLLSRYEEYLAAAKDEHRRFDPQNSILVIHELIERPLINEWALILKEKLLKIDPQLEFKPRRFEYLSTIDIDQAWKFKNKGFGRNFLGFFRDLIYFKYENFLQRLPVLMGISKDPFYNFEYQLALHEKYEQKLIYFILLGQYGKYDKNTSSKKIAFRNLIQNLDKHPLCETAYHPSYASNYSKKQLEEEIHQLRTITGRPIKSSRQHFLKLKFPGTYNRLRSYDVSEDYTMGYTSHSGFRAGIAAPFPFFDLSNNQSTELMLIPFCFMDISPLHYAKRSPYEAIEHMKILMNSVESVGGLFVSLWHNESLSETERWRGWRIVYEEMLIHASEKMRVRKK